MMIHAKHVKMDSILILQELQLSVQPVLITVKSAKGHKEKSAHNALLHIMFHQILALSALNAVVTIALVH